MPSKRFSAITALTAAILFASLLLTTATNALADTEGPNRAHVVAGIVDGDLYGGCYAKSVPVARWGMQGTTRVYEVRRGKDRLVATYNWYAKTLFLRCRRKADGALKARVVRLGPWQRGRQASKDDLAIAFYSGDRELARFSTLDLAGRPDNVQRSVSHYLQNNGGALCRLCLRQMSVDDGHRNALKTGPMLLGAIRNSASGDHCSHAMLD
jgi:hypothetical protein